ncbi:MAG: hypothetical protein ACFCUI_03395 [Bernardetiaceae bacterium]
MQAQSVSIPVDQDYYALIDRLEIKYGRISPILQSSSRPYTRQQVAAFADTLFALRDSLNLTAVDLANLRYLMRDNWEWSQKIEKDYKSRKPFLKHFYRTKPDFFHVQSEYYGQGLHQGADDFDLHISPVLHFGMGYETENDRLPYINSRGVALRATIADRIGVYTFITDNQARFPFYVLDRSLQTSGDFYVPNVPGEAFTKWVRERDDFDYIHARGYIAFRMAKVVQVQFGQDKHFIGPGYRSLFLSDYSAPSLFLKLNTRFWKIEYTNLFTQLVADVQRPNNVYPKKYAVFHRLGINIGQRLNLGLSESVVYSRPDGKRNDTFEIGYLNPVIFYTAVEQGLGTPDNAGLYFDAKYLVPGMSLQLYASLLIDDMVVSEFRSGDGWWGNRQAAQIGFRYVDAFGIPNLDLLGEFNYIRPYTYTQNDSLNLANHSHFLQALAHPMGANLWEIVGWLHYQPLPALRLSARVIYTQKGEDPEGQNWGGDILKDLTFRQQEYGNRVGQGIATQLLYAELTASYQLRHNLFLDWKSVFRRLESEDPLRERQTFFTGIHLRLNTAMIRHDF